MPSQSINLAPGTQYVIQARRRRRKLYALSFVLIITGSLIWTGLLFYKGQVVSEREKANDALRSVRLEIAKLETEAQRIVLFESRLGALGSLLDNHHNWNIFFQELERLMPPETALNSVEIASGPNLAQIGGRAANIDQVAVALATLSQPSNPASIFKEGKVLGTRREVQTDEAGNVTLDQVLFEAELTFDPKSLLRN